MLFYDAAVEVKKQLKQFLNFVFSPFSAAHGCQLDGADAKIQGVRASMKTGVFAHRHMRRTGRRRRRSRNGFLSRQQRSAKLRAHEAGAFCPSPAPRSEIQQVISDNAITRANPACVGLALSSTVRSALEQ
jgi:hypothetical protein